MTRRLCLALSLILLACPAIGEEFTLVAFNVESGGVDENVIAGQLSMLSIQEGVEIFALSEVAKFNWARIFDQALETATGREHGFWFGDSGNGDHLTILYDKTRLKMIDQEELDDINPGKRVRSPLVVTLESRSTGERFRVMANHLYRGRADLRLQQAADLNQWVRDHADLPTISAGDFNFDWDIASDGAERDRGFDRFLQDGVWEWVRPEDIVRTQCSNFNSVLDFVFVGAGAQDWTAESEILFSEDTYCPDDNDTSDHRPVLAQFDTGGMIVEELSLKDRLLERIQALEDELQTLRDLVESID